MRNIASMLLGLLLSVFIDSNRVIAATLATLQSEGDAIYDMSQAIPSLVTKDGERLLKSVDSMTLLYTNISSPHLIIFCLQL